MKRNLITILSLVVMSLMFNATSAPAQSFARADVPFAFNVGQKQLPAGTYEVKIKGAGSDTLIIQNIESGESALSVAENEAPRSTEGKLVFNHVGNEYFLSQVWRESGSQGKRLPISKRERGLTKELLLAKDSKGGHEEVIVALRRVRASNPNHQAGA
jgi:hypothetical protein